MLDAEILPPARIDYEESYVWYWKQSRRAAERFSLAVDEAIERLRDDPKLGLKIDDEHRAYRLKRNYPFYLAYRTEPNRIVIVAVAHNACHPDFWRER